MDAKLRSGVYRKAAEEERIYVEMVAEYCKGLSAEDWRRVKEAVDG